MLIEFLNTYQSAVLIGISLCICAIVTGGTYAIARVWRAREGIRKRATVPVSSSESVLDDRRSLRHQKLGGASRLLGTVAAYFVPVGDASVSAVRKNLNNAGYFNASALAWSYLIRGALALLFPALFLVADQILVFDIETSRYLTALLGSAIAGLMAPSF